MTGRLFRVTADFPNFERTVVDPIVPADFSPPPDVPRELCDGDPVRIWGTRKGGGNREQYEVMDPGDGLVFYVDDRPSYAGVLGRKFQTPWVSRTFWGYAPAELLYTVEDFGRISADPDRVRGALGPGAAEAPDGIEEVGEVAVSAIERRYGSVRGFIASLDGE